jgi:NAD(P)-dependent dehydrogenase (short-subunit alcohol dehydrogenase family)
MSVTMPLGSSVPLREQPPRDLHESRIAPAPDPLVGGYAGSGKLQGRVAIVTGGESGIGRATCVLFAREGAAVALSYLPDEQVDAEITASMVAHEGQRCLLLPGDLQDRASCDQLVRDTVRHYGRLDVLVNNAAFQRHRESIADIDDDQWDRTFRANVYAYFYLARAALAYMSRGSSIVNVGSAAGLDGSGQLLDYAAAEGAILAFTKSLAKNLLGRGIRVNAVAPPPASPPKLAEPSIETAGHPPLLTRPIGPPGIAPAIVYLASETDSSYVTGEVLTLLGASPAA